MGEQLERLVADLREAHVATPAHAAAESSSGSPSGSRSRTGTSGFTTTTNLAPALHRDVHVRGRADAAVDQLAALHLDRLVDHRQRGGGRGRLRDRHVVPVARRRARSARRCRGRSRSGRARSRACGSRWCGRGRRAPRAGSARCPRRRVDARRQPLGQPEDEVHQPTSADVGGQRRAPRRARAAAAAPAPCAKSQ